MLTRLRGVLFNQRGGYVEEMMILPIKLGVFFLLIEFGLLLFNSMVMVYAWSWGLRQAEIEGGVTPAVVNGIRQRLDEVGTIDSASVTINGTTGPVPFNGDIFLELKHDYGVQTLGVLGPFTKTFNLHPRGHTTSSKVVR